MSRIIAIPARYASTRLPGKPLRIIAGKTLIEHVVANAAKCKLADEIVVATDDERILDAARAAGANAVMTGEHCASGTDRISEALKGREFEHVLNLQGDEPLVPPGLLDEVFGALTQGAPVATAARKLRSPDELSDPSRVKVVCDSRGHALIFSRAAIPHARELSESSLALETARVHVGVYGFQRKVLESYSSLERPAIEAVERLEQLRLLHAGYDIKVLECADFGDSIDTLQRP
ncbi:MAG: 3-deoxy-manno-octulosonate cytidylyltransferase [Planctomycetota bacterium]|nr:3-deoxy-manno-octulosonate cytidylyltransferase [Planctomycetota bacterium]